MPRGTRVIAAVSTLSLVAMLLLAGCASEAGAPAIPEAPPTSTASATPTSTPDSAPRIPFGADCEQLLPASALTAALGATGVRAEPMDSLLGVMPDTSASTARLGGLACRWGAEGAEVRGVTVALLPAAVVPDDFLVAGEDLTCHGWGSCGRAEERSGVWVRVDAHRLNVVDAMGAAEEAAVSVIVGAVLAEVLAHPDAALLGIPETAAPDGWSLECAGLLPAVEGVLGASALEPGYPTDYVPDGPVWDILLANDVVAWCPWYAARGQDPVATEIDLQRGVGAPTPEQLQTALATPIEIPGTDAAYLVAVEGPGSDRTTKVLAISGSNRLTVGGTDAETIAAAVLAVLKD